MAIIADAYMDAVVSIGQQDNKGNYSWCGTGFMVHKTYAENKSCMMLITNRHVIENKNHLIIRIKKKNSDILFALRIVLQGTEHMDFSIHSNPRIDIAAMYLPWNLFSDNDLEMNAFDLQNNAITSEEIVEHGGGAGTIVYMLGYPMGLAIVDSNLPICRMGCIARLHPKEIAREHVVILDIQNFPGNSGSPVITRPEIISVNNTKAMKESSLVGIVRGYIPYTEQLLNLQTKQIVETRSENSGLAVMHPVEYINDVIDIEAKRISLI